MEESKHKATQAPFDPEFTDDSSWPHGVDGSDGSYFYSGERDRSIQSEYGWNIDLVQMNRIGSGVDGLRLPVHSAQTGSAEPVDPTALAATTSRSNNQSVSTSSSEDLPEKSTVFDGKPLPEIASKSKKMGQKRMKQPRFAFMTKSDVDHLEDGYRWRKYGQKAVKNSPFPRSYYRCTNSKCMVKKRVERSSENPTIVITTYEGQHCHHTIGFPRGGITSTHESVFSSVHLVPTMSHLYYPIQNPVENNNNTTLRTISQACQTQDEQVRGSNTVIPADELKHSPIDEGLLGDIVPPGMRNI